MHYLNFVNYRNMYDKLKRKTKKNYYTEWLQKYYRDTRNIWKTLRSLLGRYSNNNILNEQYILNDELINYPKTIADSFCEYFSSVGNKFASAIPPSNKPPEFYFTKHGKRKNILKMYALC